VAAKRSVSGPDAKGGAFAGQRDGIKVGGEKKEDVMLGATEAGSGFKTEYSHRDLDPNAVPVEKPEYLSESSSVPRSELTDEQLAELARIQAERKAEIEAAEEKKEKVDEAKRALAADLEPMFSAWEFSSGIARPLRSLLSTLHTVLWSGSEWTTISVSDVLTPVQVKKQYFKAMRVVHPDKISVDAPVEHVVRAERAFKALDAAKKKFDEELARTGGR